MWSDLDLT